MKKYIGYIPAVLFTAMYLFVRLTGASLEYIYGNNVYRPGD